MDFNTDLFRRPTSSCELLGAPGENKLHIYIFINYIYRKQVSFG